MNNENNSAEVQKKENKEIKVSDIRVSAKTAKYIVLKDELIDLWNELYDAMEEDYGIGAGKMFESSIEPHLLKVSDEIEGLMMVSINEVRNLKKGII